MADSGNVAIPTPTPATQASPAVPGVPDYALRFSDTAVELGYCTREVVEDARQDFEETRVQPDKYAAFLVEKGLLSREQARACERALRGGSVIGGFAILEKVGQGGMGSVFRARQISMDRIVAVKILAPKYAQDPAFKERFLNEARTSAKLSHLNIINGIDCGEDAGYAFFAMEYVDGQTLRKLMKERGKLSVDEAFSFVRQICDALSYARKLDMVHRDIKPDNIMVTPAGVAKLCDLGLAIQAEAERKEEEQAEAESAKQSGADGGNGGATPPKKKGVALGTPHYMSPEQARGMGNVDARSDIYSLGATIFHLITGQTMFAGTTSAAIMTQHVTAVAPNPCTIDPTIPRALGCIVAMMTAKAAENRYANVDELSADLDRFKRGSRVHALTFAAESSCAPPPPAGLFEGPLKWLPHAAALLIVGALAYVGVQYIAGKPNSVVNVAGGTHPTVPTVTGVSSGDPKATTHTTATESKPPDIVKTVPSPTTVVGVTPEKTKPIPTKDPKPSVTAEAHVTHPVVPEPPVAPAPVEPAVPPPPLEIARPELKLTPEILYTRFLGDVDKLAGRFELSKLYSELEKVAQLPEYAPARAEIVAELADLKAARDFENAALKTLAEKHETIQFSPTMAATWGVSSGKAASYDEKRGLDVEIKGGASFCVPASKIGIEEILAHAADHAADKGALGRVQFHYAHGRMAEAVNLLAQVSAEEQKRWGRKIELRATHESELVAQLALDNLAKVVEARAWKTLTEMIADFNKDYGTTLIAKANAAKILDWQATAAMAQQPASKWARVFHAAMVLDVLEPGQPNQVQLTYDFTTPEQVKDFLSLQNGLRIENKRLILPPGGGAFASLRFVAPVERVSNFQIVCKTLNPVLQPIGVAFLDGGQVSGDPDANSTMLRFIPETRIAVLVKMQDISFESPKPPEANWLRDLTYGFKMRQKGRTDWTIDDKLIYTAKFPKFPDGGWLAIWAENGNLSVKSLKLTLRPDPVWEDMMLGGQPKSRPKPPPPPPRGPDGRGPPDDNRPPPPGPPRDGVPPPPPRPPNSPKPEE